MRRSFPNSLLPGVIVLAAGLVSGCATYHPKPLPTKPDLARLSALTVPAKIFDLPGFQPHSMPTNGLDETTVVTLAVVNNPNL